VGQQWNPDLYQASHGFVWEYGRDLLKLLDPKPGERVLDAGCGTGQLTAAIARTGAEVVGIDRSWDMVAQARGNFPALRFEVADICAIPWGEEFDAVFSNAVLHWVTRAREATAAMARSLKPGGRLAVELGARGNIAEVMRAADAAVLTAAGTVPASPWFYPSLVEYANILEGCGLEVSWAATFDRPTPLEGGAEGLARWLEMFGRHWLERLDTGQLPVFHREVESLAAPQLFRDGQWSVDYRRLRVLARKR
jgi:trans-aconitate 2-methyltransferase